MNFDEELITATSEIRDRCESENLYARSGDRYSGVNQDTIATAFEANRTDALREYLRNAAHEDRLIQEIAGAYYDDEITFEELEVLVGPEDAANFRVLKHQLDESLTEELADL